MTPAPEPSPLAVPTQTQLRRELIDLVVGELAGPAGGADEILRGNHRPRDRYLVGAVPPRGMRLAPEREDGLGIGADDPEEAGDDDEPGTRSSLPSSVGITFHVLANTPAIVVGAAWGRYERVDDPDEETGRVWRRITEAGEIKISCAGNDGPVDLAPVAEHPEVRLQIHVRPAGADLAVTIFLRNDQPEPESNRDAAWLFQVEMSARAPDGAAVIVASDRPFSPTSSAEERRLRLAYRRRREFAVGHGIAVSAEVDPADPARATAVRTRVIPRREVPQTGAPDDEPRLADLECDMYALADADDKALPAMLEPLISGYGGWIARQRERVARGEDDLGDHAAVAEEVLAEAEAALVRMGEGIAVLRSDPAARAAFRFANRAMALQRIQGQWAEHRRRGGDEPLTSFDVPGNRRWRPFQLAFLLLGLPALADPAHPDRSADPSARCDLLWFPTGGGKTEAYLGLAAFAMAIRRLQGALGGRRADAGVAVLMRYTLRVLTLQQFQRAAALVCAGESLRRADPAMWGDEPFRIGLWVGQRMTPNSLAQAEDAIANQRGQGYVRTAGGRPDQLSACPWCGSAIDPGRDVVVETYAKGRARVLTYCPDTAGRCEFSRRASPGEGLPVITVDEEIYRRLPSLVIATVDKFAQMPWNGAIAALFGTVDGRCERHGFRAAGIEDADSHVAKGPLPRARTVERGTLLRPPDLIIQDELHLISGPLGTMVGLYETAVDHLATWDLEGRAVRPKVIAATATVRQARDQVRALFLRDVAVFPPQGLDADDSFFARERPVGEEDYGRLYLGICAPGRRLKVALIRTYFAFLAAAQVLYERHGGLVDPWMTLVGYFASIRELAGARRACEDDIRTRLIRAADHGLARRSITPNSIEELTSRLSAADIPRLLDQMERAFPPAEDEGRPLDVLLATNMISVGVDIRRLGLMVAAGQPKTTAEYIQATSRVGRATPGIVCTVFNWARPRDLSHYTRFEHYHDCFYRHVEPLSVTPFAKRALDRGLTALLAAMVRLSDPASAANGAAHDLDPDGPVVMAMVEAIAARAGAVDGTQATVEEVGRQIAERLDAWRSQADGLAANGSRLGYQTGRDSTTLGLLHHPGGESWQLFTALDSLRDVEATADLVLRDTPFWSADEGADE